MLAQVLVLLAFCAFVASLVMAKPSQRQGELHDEVIETKPNQRQGKSHDEVTKARLSLDRKVAKIRAIVAASDIKEPKRPDGVLTGSCRQDFVRNLSLDGALTSGLCQDSES